MIAVFSLFLYYIPIMLYLCLIMTHTISILYIANAALLSFPASFFTHSYYLYLYHLPHSYDTVLSSFIFSLFFLKKSNFSAKFFVHSLSFFNRAISFLFEKKKNHNYRHYIFSFLHIFVLVILYIFISFFSVQFERFYFSLTFTCVVKSFVSVGFDRSSFFPLPSTFARGDTNSGAASRRVAQSRFSR